MPLLTVRYGLPLGLFLLGVVFLIIEPNTTGIDGFCAATGAALALLLLNVLFRTGVAGDRDRVREEEAREYFDKHGRWPDEDAEARRRAAEAAAEAPEDAGAPAPDTPDTPRPLRDAVRPSAEASSPNRDSRREGARIAHRRPSRRP